jgi:hypothetical protein
MEVRLVSRCLLLIGTPVVLASLMIIHQLIDQFERPVAFLALHLLLLPLFALMGVAIWVLLDGVGGALAWAARVAAFLFLVGYVALDAISGIAASAILASGAPWSKEATRALFASGPAAQPRWLSSPGACLCCWVPWHCTGPGGRSRRLWCW